MKRAEEMKKYRIQTEMDFYEADSYKQAWKIFHRWKDDMMAEGVVADETFIAIIESEDDFETETVIRKLIAVVDNERMELGTPEQEGIPDWEYWAKWQEVKEEDGKPVGINIPAVETWPITHLRNTCKKNKVKGYTKMDREQLIHEVKEIIKRMK